jgi:hypothetical protein
MKNISESEFSVDRVEEVPKIAELKVDDVTSFFAMHVFRHLTATVVQYIRKPTLLHAIPLCLLL